MQNLKFNQDGICPQAQFIESPNYDLRESDDINLIVIHNISLPPGEYSSNSIIDLFTNQLNANEHPYYAGIAHLRVSSHFLIRRDGHLIQFVPCTKRAWHAGVSSWNGKERCNDFSIGIELEGSDFEAFEPNQYDTLKLLIASLKASYSIQAIVGHSDIAPGRKTDPGPYFNWSEIDA
jgi:AmpD protein